MRILSREGHRNAEKWEVLSQESRSRGFLSGRNHHLKCLHSFFCPELGFNHLSLADPWTPVSCFQSRPLGDPPFFIPSVTKENLLAYQSYSESHQFDIATQWWDCGFVDLVGSVWVGHYGQRHFLHFHELSLFLRNCTDIPASHFYSFLYIYLFLCESINFLFCYNFNPFCPFSIIPL